MAARALSTDMPQVVSPEQFKGVMRRLGSSVAVITSRHDARVNGMTATAVCSVSADPPSLLVVVNRANASHAMIRQGQAFAVNLLSQSQSDLAERFARRTPDPFSDVPHTLGVTGCPLLEECSGSLECTVVQETEVGTHTIFIGHVVSAKIGIAPPLLYHEGTYHALSALKRA